MKSSLLAILILGVGGLGTYWWTQSRKSSTASSALGADAARPRTATVQRGNVRFAVSVAGEIGPSEQVSVRPEVNGRISDLPVDVGDRVPKGGLLFALDDRDLRIEVETRKKEIESARLQLDKARIAKEQAQRDFNRDEELFEAHLLAEQEYENSRQRAESASKDYDLALDSIERTEKDLDLAEERLLRTKILAPFDCTVLTRSSSMGQAVSGSGGFNSGTEVLTIADLTSMIVSAHVNQADVTHLKQGMQVAVEIDAIPGLKIRGEVERIAPQSTIKNNIKGYTTRILLRDLEARVQPGMTATLSIPVATAEDVLTVPLAAVFSEEGQRYVLVKSGESFERRPVVVGVSDFFVAEITSGVSAGDVVAIEQPPAEAIRPTSSIAGSTALSQANHRAPQSPPTSTPATPAATPSAGAARPAATTAPRSGT